MIVRGRDSWSADSFFFLIRNMFGEEDEVIKRIRSLSFSFFLFFSPQSESTRRLWVANDFERMTKKKTQNNVRRRKGKNITNAHKHDNLSSPHLISPFLSLLFFTFSFIQLNHSDLHGIDDASTCGVSLIRSLWLMSKSNVLMAFPFDINLSFRTKEQKRFQSKENWFV